VAVIAKLILLIFNVKMRAKPCTLISFSHVTFQDEDLAMIAAQQHYIDFGTDMMSDRLQTMVATYIPDSALLGQKSLSYWTSKISTAFRQSYFVTKRIPPMKVKEDIVNYAKYKWPLLFSRFYEAYKFAGPSLPKNDVIIAVNWTGVYVVDDQEQVLLELSYPEITAVSSSRSVAVYNSALCFFRPVW